MERSRVERAARPHVPSVVVQLISFRSALFALALSIPLSARADIPIDDIPTDDPAQQQPDDALSDFERGERVGRMLGGCACPACCGLVAIGSAIGIAVAVSRKKKSP